MTGTGTQHISIEPGPVARRVLKKLAQGKGLKADGAVFRAGSMVVPATVVEQLQRADLIEGSAGAGFDLSLPGRNFLARTSATADPYARQNRLIVKTERKIDGKQQKFDVNLADNPLAWLARRKLLTEAQVDAGDRLRGDFYQSQTPARVTMNWGAPPLGSAKRGAPEGLDPTLAQISAKGRLERAFEAAGPGLRDILIRVVCAGEGLESAERALHWPNRAAKLVLSFALDRLVDHYAIRR
jgi:Domain of unknown function (DUF6456)